jgi:hypothetical protein
VESADPASVTVPSVPTLLVPVVASLAVVAVLASLTLVSVATPDVVVAGPPSLMEAALSPVAFGFGSVQPASTRNASAAMTRPESIVS